MLGKTLVRPWPLVAEWCVLANHPREPEYIFYLPVPEKTQVQHNYVIFPKGTCLPSKTNPSTVEPLVFTIPAAAPKEGTVGGSEASSASAVSDTYKDLFHWAFDRRLKSAGNAVDIVSANPGKFHSMVRQAHRPNEKAVHINGFRGSKDGYLFFLETGILWGFKKPLIFIPLNRIAAISYTNILQITFNMVVEVFPADGDETENEELEFGMLDQQDYGGIDDYVKTHRLQDRSMAEQRKGKLQLAENKQGAKKNGEAAENGDATGDDGLTELERAQKEAEQQAQDEEDEDEEDYDPGSDGESEGSGSSSEEDDDDDDDAEGDGDADEDDEVSAAEEGGEDGEDGQENAAADDDDDDDEHIPVKPEPQEAKPQKPAPAARGWAAVGKKKQPQPPPSMDVDMDDEKFDVV